MKRFTAGLVALALSLTVLTLTNGCASTSGEYFARSRQNKPYVNRNRIYNPGDYRYPQAPEE
jgi:hypothetical protein